MKLESFHSKMAGAQLKIESFHSKMAGAQMKMGSFHSRIAGVQPKMQSFHSKMAGVQLKIESFHAGMASVQLKMQSFTQGWQVRNSRCKVSSGDAKFQPKIGFLPMHCGLVETYDRASIRLVTYYLTRYLVYSLGTFGISLSLYKNHLL